MWNKDKRKAHCDKKPKCPEKESFTPHIRRIKFCQSYLIR